MLPVGSVRYLLESEDELAGGAPTDGSGTPAPTPAVSRAPTPDPAPTQGPAPVPAPGTAPMVAPTSHKELCQQLMKTYAATVKLSEQNQTTENQDTGPRERPLKARFPDLYFGNSHMDCYRFCQQCEDHFETAKATGSNRVSFSALFLRGMMTQRWLQHKRRLTAISPGPPTWSQFKSFLRKNLGDSRAFVDGIWSKVKRDSQFQLEEVQDWAAHREHLQSILLEFDNAGASTEAT